MGLMSNLNRRQVLASGTVAILAGGSHRARAQVIPATPEPGAVKMGVSPWLGTGIWEIAAQKGLFTAHGLEHVDLVNFTTDSDMNAALASGAVQCACLSPQGLIHFLEAGLPVRVVLLLDVSMTADAIISDGSVSDVAGLRGKRVAYEEGSTSDLLLNYALAQAGMTIADVEKVPMPASDAGAAVIAGQVPVAVTYEPYQSVALKQNPKVKVIFDAARAPGLISDILVVRDDYAEAKPGQIVALIRAWDAGLVAYQADVAGSRALISTAIGSKPEELASGFDGIAYYSAASNKTELGGRFATQIVPAVYDAAKKAGLVTREVDLAKTIDTRFVDAALR